MRMSEVEQDSILTLTDEDGAEHEFQVLDVIELESKMYAILQPVGSEEDEAIILRVEQDPEGNEVLMSIEDDDEWDRVAEAYDTLLFEEMSGEDN